MAEAITATREESIAIGHGLIPANKRGLLEFRRKPLKERIVIENKARDMERRGLVSKIFGGVVGAAPKAVERAFETGKQQLERAGKNISEGFSAITEPPSGKTLGPRADARAIAEQRASQSKLGVGLMQAVNVVPTVVGEGLASVTEDVSIELGASPKTAQMIGAGGNILSQFVTSSGLGPLAKAGKFARSFAPGFSLFKNVDDPLRVAVRESIEDVFLTGGRQIAQRRQLFRVERSFGNNLKKLERKLDDEAGTQIQEALDNIPQNVQRDALSTRGALRDFLDRTGFLERGARKKIPLEREAEELQEIVGGFSQEQITRFKNDFGIDHERLVQMTSRREVNVHTLDRFRRDVGNMIRKSKDRNVRDAGYDIIDAIREDVQRFAEGTPGQLNDFGYPTEISQLTQGLTTFRTRIFPLREIVDPVEASNILDSIHKMSAEELTKFNLIVGQELADDTAALLFTEAFETSFDKAGAFDAGTFVAKFDARRQKLVKQLSGLLNNEVKEAALLNLVDVIEEGGAIAAKLSKMGQFARPFAMLKIGRDVISGNPLGALHAIPAFAMPAILKKVGLVRGGLKIIEAGVVRSGKVPIGFSAIRQLFAAIEATRREFEREMTAPNKQSETSKFLFPSSERGSAQQPIPARQLPDELPPLAEGASEQQRRVREQRRRIRAR